jgi:hypothetical protein
MPVLTSSDQLAPKSVLRHRPIGTHGTLAEPPRVPRASRTQTHRPAPTSTTTPVHVPVEKSVRALPVSWRQRLLVVGVGIGMILAVLLVFVGQLLIGWMGTGLDDLHYGRPRTFQADAVVGQNDSPAHPSHFIALNFNGQIEVIDFPGGDATHARVYLGPHLYGANASLVPVTLQFIDTRHDHHPDMIVLVQGEHLIFHNGGGAFHSPATGS